MSYGLLPTTIVAMVAPVAGSIRLTTPGKGLESASSSVAVTHSEPAPLAIASAPWVGVKSTGTTLSTVLVAGLIRERVLSHQLVTQTPDASITTPDGLRPTTILAATYGGT